MSTNKDIEETMENNNVVAAMCCKWCIHNLNDECALLGIQTYPTDVCDNFKQQNEENEENKED